MIYFDDCVAVFDGPPEELDQLLHIADNIVDGVRITFKRGTENVEMLDMRLHLRRVDDETQQVTTTFFRKSCQPLETIPPRSAHGPWICKDAIAQEVFRRLARCTFSQDAISPIEDLFNAGRRQGHTRRFLQQAIAKGRERWMAVLQQVQDGLRPLYRNRSYRIARRGLRKRVSKPGLPTIWVRSDSDHQLHDRMKRWLTELNLTRWLQVGCTSGPSLIKLCRRSELQAPAEHNNETCLICLGNDLEPAPMPDLPPTLQARPLKCHQSNCVYLWMCTKCRDLHRHPAFYVGQTRYPAKGRCGEQHRQPSSAIFQHQQEVHDGEPCGKFFCLHQSNGHEVHRLLTEAYACRLLMSHWNGIADCLNDATRLVRTSYVGHGAGWPQPQGEDDLA
jgi:hypothetical protein